MVVHLTDLLHRRMPLLILARLNEATLRRVAEWVAPVMGWDESVIKREVVACLNAVDACGENVSAG